MADAGGSSPTHATAEPYRWVMLAGIWLLYFSFGLTVLSLAPLVGPITAELGISHAAMGGIFGVWPLVYIASAMPCGAVMDRFGPRRALFLATLIMALSGILRALSVDHWSLLLAVAVFGIGGPLISIGAPKVITLWFEGKERGLAMGIYVTGPALGNISALALTNSLMMRIWGDRWRPVLAGYAGFVLLVAVVWLLVSGHRASRAVERRLAAEPKQSQLQVFAGLVRLPIVQTILVMSVGIFFFNHGLGNWLPEILRHGGMDAETAGFWSAIPNIMGIVAALLIPRFAVPERRLTILFGLFLVAGVASLLLHQTAGIGLATGLVLQGTARGTMMAVLVLLLVETRDIGPRHAGSAAGMFFSAAEIGGVMGPLTVGHLYDATGDFDAALFMMTGVCALLMLLLLRFRRLGV